jgi:hypothetical protein
MNQENFIYFIPRANHFLYDLEIALEVAMGQILGDLWSQIGTYYRNL